MKLKIVTVPHPILRKKAVQVNPNRPEIKKLSLAMKRLLVSGNNGKPLGVGLSAPQIGQSLKIIVVYSKSSRRYLTMLNPQILWRSKREKLGIPGSKNPFEGCLSVPGLWGKVRRSSVVKVFYQTPWGSRVIRKFRGLTGVVAQHEIDHLEGILFTDHVLRQGNQLYKLKKDKEGKEKLMPVQR